MAQRSHGIFFSIPAGKIYLSPIVDCFDGFIPSWTAGTSPNATLVNEMLLKGVDKLKPDEKPILHMDRGCHYRWQGWIGSISPKISDSHAQCRQKAVRPTIQPVKVFSDGLKMNFFMS